MADGVPYTIHGVKVIFPCKAYPTQLSMMDKVSVSLSISFDKTYTSDIFFHGGQAVKQVFDIVELPQQNLLNVYHKGKKKIVEINTISRLQMLITKSINSLFSQYFWVSCGKI